MSIPEGAKVLKNISSSSYNFLTGNNQAKSGWASAKNDFATKGKPKYNFDKASVKLEDLELINSNLPENQKDYVFSNNSIYTSDNVATDLIFTNTPSEEYLVDITFIDEGAGYKNTLGYYFYVIDGEDIIIIDNDDSNTDNKSGYFRPTVIFPNASSVAGGWLRSDGVLLPGNKRRLKGNLANGKFQNVNVGFFIVPNGWGSDSVGVRYDNKPILHTQSRLNPNHVDGAIGSANSGYQSVLFKYNNGEMYIIGFEDIQRPGGDGDFNDLIFRVETRPVINLSRTASITPPVINSGYLHKTKLGLLLVANTGKMGANFGKSGYRYRIKRRLNFDTEFNRDRYLAIYKGDYLVYRAGVNVTYQSVGSQAVDVEYDIDGTDLSQNVPNDKVQYYIFETESNLDDETVLDSENPDVNERTRFDKTVLTQRLENDNVLNEDHNIIEDEYDVDNNKTRSTTLVTDTNVVPYNTTGSSLIWGDPHIKRIDGSIYTLLDEGRFDYLSTSRLKIEVDCRLTPDHPVDVYKGMSFISNVYVTDLKTGRVCNFDVFNKAIPHTFFDREGSIELSDTAPSPTSLTRAPEGEERDGSLFQVYSGDDLLSVRQFKPKYLSLLSFDHKVNVKVLRWRRVCDIWIIFYEGRPDFFNEIYLSGTALNSIYEKDWTGLIIG